jgi:hypothetical protein
MIDSISLWQPYASLIAIGAKPFETRHWSPPANLIGKRVAIHAAARKPTRNEIDDLREDCEEAFVIGIYASPMARSYAPRFWMQPFNLANPRSALLPLPPV